MQRSYDALVLDIDGTLLDDREQLPVRTAEAIAAARKAGVKVMLATGRSHGGVHGIAERLKLDLPSVVLNGAAVYSHHEARLVDYYCLPASLSADLVAFARRARLLPVVAGPTGQYVRIPRPEEQSLLQGFHVVSAVPEAQLLEIEPLRLTLFSLHHQSSGAFCDEVMEVCGSYPAYFTHFPLAALAACRESSAHVVDIQPDCGGKAEALRLLQTRFNIPPERVVAVGDAGNDIPILEAAGLGVAMGNATPAVKQVAKRVIGSNNTPALAELIESLFLV